jgi:MFS family permease
MNGVGIFGRTIPSLLADRYFGILHSLIPVELASGVLLLGWIGVNSTGGLFGWAVIYGICANATQSLFPAAVGDLSTDPTRVGTKVGMILGIVSISCFTGPPIGGRLVALRDGDYLYAQLFGGFTMLAGGAAYLTSAVLKKRELKRQPSQV